MTEARDDLPAIGPLPEIAPRMLRFWEGARAGRLLLPRCRLCGALHFPAFETCSECLGDEDMDWVEASGRGRVFSFVVMHQATHPAFAGEIPYAVVDVKLDEGPRMISRLLDVPPAAIRVGMELEITFVRCSDTVHLPMFRARPVAT